MGVPCPGCGRAYDVALFQFGRTLDCTCGSRVALEPRRRPSAQPADLRFAADAMLGRLARWLRLIGCDTSYRAHIGDSELVRRAYEENRVLLTRDHRLPEEWRVPHLVVLEAEDPLAQLREIVRRYEIDWRARLFTRCTLCNTLVARVRPEEVSAHVPARVLEEQQAFGRCAACGKIYWQGSHTDHMRRELEAALR